MDHESDNEAIGSGLLSVTDAVRDINNTVRNLTKFIEREQLPNKVRIQIRGYIDYALELKRQIMIDRHWTSETTTSMRHLVNSLDSLKARYELNLKYRLKAPQAAEGGSLWDLAIPLYTIVNTIKRKVRGSGLSAEQVGGFLPLLGYAADLITQLMPDKRKKHGGKVKQQFRKAISNKTQVVAF